MLRLLLLSAVIAGAARPALAQAPPTGSIRVCRLPHIVGSADAKAVPIPKGTGFTSGDNPKTGEQLKPFFVAHTLANAVLPPKPGCVTVPAALDVNPEHFALTPKYGPLPSQLNVAGLSVMGRVSTPFK